MSILQVTFMCDGCKGKQSVAFMQVPDGWFWIIYHVAPDNYTKWANACSGVCARKIQGEHPGAEIVLGGLG